MKSNVSDPLEVLHAVYLDAWSKCPANVSRDLRDWMTIQARVKSEGLSFLTITLPSYAKDFERSLADGVIAPTAFGRFRKLGRGPVFLRGLVAQLFDYETGRLYEETSTTPILVDAVRQVCLLFKKVGLPCTRKRTHEAIEKFVQVERDLEEFNTEAADADYFANVADVLWGDMLRSLSADMLIPRHGPGATAERISGNRKYVWRLWHERLDEYFPFFDYAYSMSAFVEGEGFNPSSGRGRVIEDVTFASRDDELPVRVITVPKTLKSPRIIAIEPACMQYAQQAVQSVLYDAIESHRLSKGHVNFRDQSVNQRLALQASRDGRLATIDLSDASDRVPLSLVRLMFRTNPDLWGAIEACRSERANLPDGRILGPLRKFASMGSALCFPVEAMFFYTTCVVARLKGSNLPITRRNVHRVTRDVYVYGDDILVPVDEAGMIISHLQQNNCKVNDSKTFLSGKFRESCGVDAYAGVEVTPIYLRHLRPDDRHQANELISWVATANHFVKKGYYRAASYMFDVCEGLLGALPDIPEDSPCLGRVSFPGFHLPKRRVNGKIQAFEHLVWTPSIVYCSDHVDGYSALTKCLLKLEHSDDEPMDTSLFRALLVRVAREDGSSWDPEGSSGKSPTSWLRSPTSDPRHLERTARRGAVTLKRRWVVLS
ncbi:TPA_asm: RNA-directed RNA polymerase [ssRNA phage Gerhypos.1_4]|uniref:RNA-directed RNA polymerase n=2 Tax=Leviviricetes TaxID=2842243 RepID=A0A8S5KY26_9VIRU|nr:RNA-directed RNA polymerase [ssRNA phage Gerhypos.1_4]QDH89495.1 MAG: RNA-dependent RNA polymerase [Leviviridae sp.]DAD50184.1 TPA_asm: RNA-directed RNA polymerase [ssRNA phage Gerhypos.1_4]